MTMSRGLTYEYEDVFAACDPALVIEAATVPVADLRRAVWRSLRALQVVGDRRRVSQGDELVFAFAQCVPDLADHFAHHRAIRAADTSAAYIEEIWAAEVDGLTIDACRFLALFDHVFVGCHGTAEALGNKIGVPTTYLAPAIDHERFASPSWPPAAVDVFAMGRRPPELHQALQNWAAADPTRFYQYDTFTRNPFINDHSEHRSKLADFIRRCRYFLVNEAKTDRSGQTGGQIEVGYRFFEGAAAGSILLGPAVESPLFDEMFPWDEPMVAIDASGSDLADRIAEFDADPDRRAEMRRRNVQGSLLRHDGAHRWRQVLQTLGLDEPKQVGDRIAKLASWAEVADPGACTDDLRSCQA